MKYILLTSLLYVFISPTQAAEHSSKEHPGKVLHDKNCMECHGVSMYTRSNRKMGNIKALTTQVKRCDSFVGAQWFDEDVADVVMYLNNSYYKFPINANVSK